MLKIEKNVPLASYTTFNIGGAAKFFSRVKDENELIKAIEYAQSEDMSIFILGGGSNVLISDGGFNGLVIKLENNQLKIIDNVLECQAGVILLDAVKAVAENNLTGFEWAVGIPGTFGGAVRGNAGAFGGDMATNIKSVKFLEIKEDSWQIKEIPFDECDFEYRSSFFKKKNGLVILSAKMEFKKGNRQEIFAKMDNILIKREFKQPQNFPSAGSFFQNPVVDKDELIIKFEKDIGAPSRERKIAAGWLIEEAGLRGKKIGGAMISEKHANFLINAGDAKAKDVVMLVSFIKQQVRSKLGVQLTEEIQYVGF